MTIAWKWVALVLVLSSWLIGVEPADKKKPQATASSTKVKAKVIPRGESKMIDKFRAVPWCINGEEPEFQRYPLSDFKRFLDRNQQYMRRGRYDIKLFKIKVEGEKLGSSEFLQNYAHFQFAARKRREYNKSVLTEYEETFLEGLIVQPIFAPMGVGLPTGQFIDPEEFNCHDCEYPVGKVVGCKKRSWLNMMHPTVLVYHHRMRTPRNVRESQIDFCEFRKTQRYCFDCKPDGKCEPKKSAANANKGGGSGGGSGSGGGPPEEDEGPTEKCYENNECDHVADAHQTTVNPNPGQPPPQGGPHSDDDGIVHRCLELRPTFKCYLQDELAYDENNKTKDCGKPVAPDRDVMVKDSTKCKTENDPPEECKRYLTGKETRTASCSPLGTYYGRTSEVHGNFVWYNPPCYYTNKIRFLFLAVHSFQKGIYSVLMSGEHEFPDPSEKESLFKDHNKYIPSPLFTGFRHFCEPMTPKNRQDRRFVESEEWTTAAKWDLNEYSYSLSYDKCIRNRSTGVLPPDCEVDGRPCPPVLTKNKNIKFVPPARCLGPDMVTSDHDQILMDFGSDLVPKCDGPCPVVATTPKYVPTTEPPVALTKRTLHGALNLMTNFCIMPISIFIVRFYKETYNTSSLKGAKAWYWIHMLGSGSASIMMYFGYFSQRPPVHNSHIYIGWAYMGCLVISYTTAWMRNKKPLYTMAMGFVHGITGYACFFLALGSLHTVNMGFEPKIFAYAVVVMQLFFYIGMEAYICIMDHKFGMEPRRRHFPTIEQKFDDVPLPGAWGKSVILVMFMLTVFGLSLGTLFCE